MSATSLGSGLLMGEGILRYGFQYTGYLLQIGLVAFMACRHHTKRLASLFSYLVLLFAVDVVARPFVLYRFGASSQRYAYTYWLTDVLLALGAFLLICTLFRHTCAHEEKLWDFLRLLLVSVFVLVLGISLLSLSRNYSHLFTRFITEFQQNLYFTCLVLNTLLYLLMQQISSADEELQLLVCGLGIQFAGPAANFALMFLTPGQQYGGTLLAYLSPLCTLGMLLTWFYAVARMPKAAEVRAPGSAVQELAAAAGREA